MYNVYYYSRNNILPLQVFPSLSKYLPEGHEQTKLPAVLTQLSEQPPLPAAHSSISNIINFRQD